MFISNFEGKNPLKGILLVVKIVKLSIAFSSYFTVLWEIAKILIFPVFTLYKIYYHHDNILMSFTKDPKSPNN